MVGYCRGTVLFGATGVCVLAVAAFFVGGFAKDAHADPRLQESSAAASETAAGGAIQTELTVGGGTPGGGGSGQQGGPGRTGGDPGPGPSNSGSTDSSQGMTTEFTRPIGVVCWQDEAGNTSDRPTGEGAMLFERIRIDRSGPTPEEVTVGTDCFDPADPAAPDPDAPPPPPPPPTVTEITDLARSAVVAPEIGVSPDSRGITGVATRFWYDGPREATVSSAIRGYQITATARPTRFYWGPGDGSELLSSTRPGTEDNWAAEHIYRTKDYYTVTAQAVWEGEWTLTGYGASASGQLATIRTSSTREYQVNEFRGELRDTR